MKTQPKLIIIYGFAGVGKTTIAKRYINEHPLVLNIEGDGIIVMLGQWITHEEQAREIVFALTKSMISIHLKSGRSVLLPYLLTKASHAEEFENIAKKHGAHFFEIQLFLNKEAAIGRLMERGTWGADEPPLAEKEMPVINQLYDTMVEEMAKRLNTINISVSKDDIDNTYKEFLKVIGEA